MYVNFLVTRLVTVATILRKSSVGECCVQDQKDAQQKLQELERLREQTIKQLSSSYGTVREELQKVVADLDAEIAEVRRKSADQ